MIISIQTYAPKSWLASQVQPFQKNWKAAIYQWQRSGNWARLVVKQPQPQMVKIEATPHAYFHQIVFDADTLFLSPGLLKQLFFGNWYRWIQTWKQIWWWYTSRGFEPPTIQLTSTMPNLVLVKFEEKKLPHVDMIDRPLQTYLNWHPNHMVSMKALDYKLRYLKQLYKSHKNQAYALIRFSPPNTSYGVHFQTFTHTLHASSDEFVFDWFQPWMYVTSESAASFLTRLVSRLGHYECWFQWREQACASLGFIHTIKYQNQWTYQWKVAFDISSRLFCQWPLFKIFISSDEMILVHMFDRIEYHQGQMCLFMTKHQMGVMLPWKFHLAINDSNHLCSGLSF
jgi:hypothetical protein